MDNRGDARRRMLRAGTIEFDGGAIDCTVRNLSDPGAMVQVASPIGISTQFALRFGGGQVMPCRVVWRQPNRNGVAFE
jgi:hypothetical protein